MRAIIGPNGAGQDDDDGRHHRQDAPRRGRRHVRRPARSHQARRGRDRHARRSAASSRSRPCSRTTPSRTISCSRPRRRAACSTTLFGRDDADGARRRSTGFSSRPGSGDQRGRVAGSLSHGQKQWLEIGMLLAQDPKLLLVDEPVAGMTDAETVATAELSARDRARSFGRRGRARHGLRARARRQGDGACTKARCWPRARSTR